MLKTKIIASSITNLTDARYFAAWGVEAIGFDLNMNSPSFILPSKVNAMKEWISGPNVIGEFSGLQDKAEIDEIIGILDLDGIQLGPFTPVEWKFNLPVYREVLLDQTGEFPIADYYVLKSDYEVSDEEIKVIKEICKQGPCFLDMKVTAANISHIIDEASPEGFILRGGEEEKVGYKSFDEIDLIFEEIEIN